MSPVIVRFSPLWIGASVLLLAGSLSTRGAGVASGQSSVPANASRTLNSCSQCHGSSMPAPGRTNGPTTSLLVANRVLQPGQQTTVTTTATGGVTGTSGGFLCEATAGTFTAGANSHVNTGGNSITHSSNAVRSWTFNYTAPNVVGPVEITSVVMTTSGSSTSGDRFAFSGFDSNATVGTPVRVFVLPAGVQNLGTSCPDGYGNYSVLGATSAPVLGNQAFGFQMLGVTPSSAGIIYYAINPPGFTSVDLGPLLGLTGCSAYIVNPLLDNMALTTAGVAARAEGSCSFALPLPIDQALAGLTFQTQGAYFDPSVPSRAMTISLTNGLAVTIQ